MSKSSLPPSRDFPCRLSQESSSFTCCTVLESINEAVVTIDLDKKINSFNRAAEAATGFRRQEAIGQFCFDVLRTSICDSQCLLEQCFSGNASAQDIPAFIINKAGDQTPVSMSAFLLRDEDGKPEGIIEVFRDLTEIDKLRRQLSHSFMPEDIVGQHPRMREIFAFLPDIAESESAVLIQGPTGSGKELFARAIHHLSPRSDGPFIAINCGALPDTLLESELFGYTKGAFTGAVKNKPGRFLLAHNGTLFLDEISSTSTAFQADLLRVLEQGEFVPLGGTKPARTDFRVVAATNRDLKAMMKEGSFREDLYYRLNVVKISLPSLQERKEDIPLLAEHFIHKYNLLKGRNIQGISPEVLSCFMKYPFPGNIRELENIIEYAFILCKSNHIELQHLPLEISEWSKFHNRLPPLDPFSAEEAEKIRQLLQRNQGNRMKTARELGISRSTLWRKIKKYRLS
ncbi:MAG: sigma 54-interacting transcriptional regulator [Deltaproteobacteria bacterium]|nr:sigma 54-interacting transcriptional regulator [Deltaproteobacteria bacterium]MBW1936109.1 sigma 54-interacting transcriptional regulator [Deltaproteobacteria bacterium]MBW2008852.1 sigma 54-interacting transcriptional regulator [Deltaproteobacteria bacterium]MBW2103419.1 sigma 54-interacting transcriptional regulator [Deltaproteobacteria bacterium]RLB40314.1 MAG: Fis family transcriptional regulator [Deltaproteobacteria bacterium]